MKVGVSVGVKVGVKVGVFVGVKVGVLVGVGVKTADVHDAIYPGFVLLASLFQRRNMLPELATRFGGRVTPQNSPSRVPVASAPS